MHTIDLFMWGYQPHFQISAKADAKEIFAKLDQNLAPNVFLLGILVQDRKDRHPICLEPEDCGYDVQRFSDVMERASHLEAVDEEQNIIHSHPLVQENYARRRKSKALKNAAQQLLSLDDEYRDVVSFCSYPVLVEGFKVIVVLQLNRKAYFSHYSLGLIKRDRFKISTSLIEATVDEFLGECANALSRPNPGASLGVVEREHDEIIRAAGKQLMYTPAIACKEFEGWHGLFESCNTISSLRYEGAEGIGVMLLSRRGHPNIDIMLSLVEPVQIHDYRAVRKLLEMTSSDVCLLSDSGFIYGLGKTTGIYDQRNEDLFTVRFTKHYSWKLFHAEHLMMQVNYGQPELPRMRINKDKFETDVKRIFKQIHPRELAYLWDLIIEASEQKHGTMVVVSSGAEIEANRLQNQATVIEPIKLTRQVMRSITAIDGAVLIDATSNCYAIGVILDGLASKKGTSARGARYNSAIRYVETSKYPCIAIVISEDGTIDLIPDLKPQISRSAVLKEIEELRKLNDEKNFDFKKFNETMSWLKDHQFYLSPEMCFTINSLRHEIENVMDKAVESATIRIVYAELVPNEEMNETYFLE